MTRMFERTNHTNRTLSSDNASLSSHSQSMSGFSAYSGGTNYTFHTVNESSVAMIFGSNKIKFHGRQRELDMLHGIYNEVCGRGRDKDSGNANGHSNIKESHSGQVIQISDTVITVPDYHSTESKSTVSTNTPSISRKVALVSGISGAGKSALVRQFINELRPKRTKTNKSQTENENENEKEKEKENEGENSNQNDTESDNRAPLFLSGKFDELAGGDPFSAMVEAFSGLTTLLLEGRNKEDDDDVENNEYEDDLERIQRDVRVCLRPEDVDVLTNIVPALSKILSNSTLPTSTSNTSLNRKYNYSYNFNVQEATEKTKTDEGMGQNVNSWNRLKYVLQLFTRTISVEDRPVVMLLDDLQWADSASLELVQALVTDKRIRNFMFIGTYRSNEVDSNHPLSLKLARISKTQPVESITIENLSLEQLIDFLHDHMKIHPFDCKNLAKKVHTATNGNLFFVIQILVELNRQCALIYSEFRKEWEWDDVAGMLVLETGITGNLEEAVGMKIRRSPKLIKKALVTMAYSRSTIDIDTLHRLMENQSRRPVDKNQLTMAMDRAVLEGFLSNSIGSNFYSFAHDKVLEGSYALMKEGRQRERFRLSMGRRLYNIGSSDDGETWMLFASAEHLNSILSLTDKDPLFIAKMNLDIGERAQKVSAFDQASKCLIAGLDALLLMPDHDPWESEYDLTLRLHRAIADVELCRGNFARGNEIGRRLLEKARSLEDRLPTYESLALALGREELHAEALEMNRDAMMQLGEYPKRFRILVLLKELFVIRSRLKKTSDSEMVKLPKMTDNSKEMALVFSRNLAIQGFYCDNNIEFLMGTIRALQITFQYGLSGYTSMSIIAYGLIQSQLNDHEGALHGARLARSILTKCEAKSQESVFRFCASYFTEGWAVSHEKALEDFRQGHLVGMEVGDVESAFLNSYAAVFHARGAGTPLGSIEAITIELLEQLDLYGIKSIYVMMEQIHLPVQYLSRTKKCIEPPWKELGVEPIGNRRLSSESLRVFHWYMARLELGVYFGNFEFADQMAKKLRSVLPRHPAYITRSWRLFYAGLAASGMARKMHMAGKRIQARRYRSKAKKLATTLGRYNRTHGPNSRHRELLMLADLNLSESEQRQVSYDAAINACLEVGHIHDAALGSELAGEYYLTQGSVYSKGSVAESVRNKLIRRHFTRARDLYNQWGAYAKVEHLHKTRGDYIVGRKTQLETRGIVSIQIDNGFSNHSNDSSEDFSIDSSPQVLYNPRLLDFLTGIVPSSETTGTLPSISGNKLKKKKIRDDVSIVSDIESDTSF